MKFLSMYSFWEKYTYKSQEQALKDCWYSQVAYWIYEDVVTTVETLNSGSMKVSQSPVKRLLGVSFNGPVMVMPTSMGAGYEYGGMGPMGMPNAGMGLSMQQLPDNPYYVKGPSVFLPVPWTGRMTNDDIDVIHFAMAVIVDSKAVSAFMKELCSAKVHTYHDKFEAGGKVESASHNQITIMQFHIEPVIRDNPIHTYYRYGKDAIVQLNLICEYVFNRHAYDGIKPDPIKGIVENQTASPTPILGGGV